MRKLIGWAVLMMVVCASCALAEIAVPEIAIAPEAMPDNASLAFVQGIRAGWNLGNTFDANGDYLNGKNHMSAETSWVGVKTSREMIDAVRAAGFNALRLPVSWHNHVDENFVIDEQWLARVQEVVDYAYTQDMYVIVNIHHDCMKGCYYPEKAELDTSKRYVAAIWGQLAARFAGYGEKLIFENINEPRLKDTQYEWWVDYSSAVCKEAIGCVNVLNQVFVDTVRAAGGNNASRYLMITPYDAAYTNAVNSAFFLPKDTAENKLIVSVHAYIPYLYALAGAEAEGQIDTFSLSSAASTGEIDGMMSKLYNRFVKHGIPVIAGEFGARDKDGNTQSRVDHAAYYVAAARARGIPCLWWDNNVFGKSGEAFGLLDRKTITWRFPEIVEAIMRYSE